MSLHLRCYPWLSEKDSVCTYTAVSLLDRLKMLVLVIWLLVINAFSKNFSVVTKYRDECLLMVSMLFCSYIMCRSHLYKNPKTLLW